MKNDLVDIRVKVREKKEAYRRYNFGRLQEEAFATFFDLAQEYTSVDNLYLISVTVPHEFFGFECKLYVMDPKTSQLRLVCTSCDGLAGKDDEDYKSHLRLSDRPYETDSSWIFPIFGNISLTNWIPFHGETRILGLFEVLPKENVTTEDRFFLEKFANRIGYNLHQKLLIQQNIEHIKFINQLVADIEHNVVSPNLYYKLFLIKFKKYLDTFHKVTQDISNLLHLPSEHASCIRKLKEIVQRMGELYEIMDQERQTFSKHYHHTSLFLETLLRKDHFEKGTYVLRKQPCNFRSEIIEPLLERYLPIFERQGIKISRGVEGIPDEEIILFVDKGLISQVFDNLFSNAVKYTEEIETKNGKRVKLVSYCMNILEDYFGPDIHGVEFSFFSTGEPLSKEDAEKVFDEGFRSSNVADGQGTGHGLHFVKNVVEIHGGKVGYKPKKCGNLFYFILPLKEEKPVRL